jgi:hypothetical protein
LAPIFLQFSTFMMGAVTGITTTTGMPVDIVDVRDKL